MVSANFFLLLAPLQYALFFFTCFRSLRKFLSSRIFPWACASGFLRRIVPDAAPQHGLQNGLPHIQRQNSKQTLQPTTDIKTNAAGTILVDGTNNNSLNNLNNNKSASMLIKRSPSTGERVL